MSTLPQDLLGKYFSGSCTPEELHQLEQWIDESPENRIELQKMEKIWFTRDTSHFSVDSEIAWKKVSEKISAAPMTVSHRRTVPLKWISGIAASLLLVSLLWINFIDGSDSWEYVASSGEKTLYELPDGSKVWLRGESQLGYSYSEDERSITMTGEGFFNVERDVNRPFVIELENSQIEVLGTSFYVKSLVAGDDQVSVQSGKVSFSDIDDSDKEVVLEAGDEAIYEYSTNDIIRKSIEDPNVMAWQTGVLEFNKTPLRAVLQSLMDYYQVSITLENDAMGNCLITSKFDNQSLEEVLEIIKKLLSAELIQVDNGYLLNGQGC